ncbi:MAG TPA: ABC transporter permease subunit, partial [Erysipelothrix sp.]|nr:ABC transporter permease subunit [Erysipelothrix sp.]
PKYWPFILVFMGIWKSIGYNSVLYYANIVGFDKSYYEAASMDGASKWKQATKITIPLLKPLVTIMTLLAIGNIFRADFGLFYQVTRNSGMLYDVTNVLDVYIYNGLITMGDIGMSTAAGLFQSTVGLVLIVITNLVVRKIDPDSALF